MLKFLKKLFYTKNGPHTVVVIDDDGMKPSSSHRISPVNLWLILLGIVGGMAILIMFLVMFTPLGNVAYDEDNVRDSVIAIQQKVAALQDTLDARNMQLKQIKSVMASGKDTVLYSATVPEAQEKVEAERNNEPQNIQPLSDSSNQRSAISGIPADAVYISNLLQRSPEFPAPFPVNGSPTRLFNSTIGHYGLDIATKEGTPFKAVADGVILSEEWTINYGYVIIVQHSNNIITIYKHASGVEKKTGESVLKGDILGTVGDTGVLSSGPHLHIEIWERGIPQNPQNYLINS